MNNRLRHHIAILGSTGSIGRQTLEIIDSFPDHFQVEVLTAALNAELLIKQAIKYKPNAVVIASEKQYSFVSEQLAGYDIKVFTGQDAIAQVVEMESVTMVMNALVGFSGFIPTINAIKARKAIALANKESLVIGGEMIMSMTEEYNTPIIPVDSEHSAILQCLIGERDHTVEKIILTASGGPFLGYSKQDLKNVKPSSALKHPNWNMGNKITIDSATLMNKGFEMIEARWLFDMEPEQIEILIHPQSVIHSMVQFHDGSIKAQLGVPDMKIPIQYALFFPDRMPSGNIRLHFDNYPKLTFEQPDIKIFRNLALAYEAARLGGVAPCVLNAANEIVVEAFLHNRIEFLEMPVIIEKCLEKMNNVSKPSLDDFIITDRDTRVLAGSLIS
ncbi:MAG: 1-deoxy-D-xylulose-5-phosphate reductoisomerase [Bacteroidetes bacterium]|nr:1-deoxy-D-xylulose-5-phosphate reductoisomerase [Bacteroidota bacterium]